MQCKGEPSGLPLQLQVRLSTRVVDVMEYGICPKCGGEKHPLNACRNCGAVSNYKKILPREKSRVKPKNSAQKAGKKQRPPKGFIVCHYCQVVVKKNRLGRHMAAHLDERHTIKAPEKSAKTQQRKLTAAEAKELKTALRDNSINTDKEIADYLKNNPVKDSSGKLGTPQDKYRWGTYGRYSIEYDAWRKDS